MSPLSRLQRLRARRTGRAALATVALAAIASIVGLLGGFSSFAAGEPASVIVRFDAGTTTEQRDAAISAVGGTVVDAIPALRMEVVEVPAEEVYGALATLRADDVVTSADLDRPREAQAAPNDPDYDVQWALDRIGWGDIYGTLDLQGTSRLAVLDTGVDANDPDLAERIVAGWSAFADETAWFDPNGHGTALASIAASVTDNGEGIAGVAYGGVEIMPVRVLDGTGVGQDADIIEGLVWAVDHGADVALMGFSSTGYSSALQAAVEYAWSNDVVVVAAVGNDGDNLSHFPAAMAKVVGVSATNQSDERWSGSNYGSSVFMAAPGTGIESILGPVTGTSPAAAIVAGAAALLQAVDPGADPGVIVGRLARNADPVASTDDVGNGILDLAAAVADGSTERVVPVGGAPVGDGGPYVTYGAAAASASATVDKVVAYRGQTSVEYTITVSNTSNASEAFRSVRITRPSADFTITACTGNANSATNASSSSACEFRIGAAGLPDANDLAAGTSQTFKLTATTASVTSNVAAAVWDVDLEDSDSFSGGVYLANVSQSSAALKTAIYMWEVTDVVIASSAPVAGDTCPSGKSGPQGQTRILVICAKNWGGSAAPPASANTSLSGTVLGTLGTFNGLSVGAGSTSVAAYYSGTVLSSTVGSVSATAVVGSSGTATSPSKTVSDLSITAVPSVTLTASSSSMAETGGSITLTATLSETYASNVTVNLTYSQTPQTDFSGASSITVLAGQTTGSITVSATSDATVEGDESFTADISTVVNALESGTQQVSFSITDDDFGTVAIDLACQSGAACRTLTEGSVSTAGTLANNATATTTTLTVTQTASPGAVSVADPGTIRIDSEILSVTANSCAVTVSSGTCTYTVAARDAATRQSHDAGATVTLVQRLPLKLTNATGDVTGTIDWETAADPSPAAGTAPATAGASCSTAGVDYVTQATTTVSLAAAASSNITVRICQDSAYEKTETFAIKLSNATGPAGATVTPATATYYVVTITNDDSAPTLAINNVTQAEGDSGTTTFSFTVTKTGSTEVDTTVDYATADGATAATAATTAGSDYTATSGTLSFAAADTTKTIAVTVNGDTLREAAEEFRVLLSNVSPVGSATISTATGLGTITNDDDGITFTVAATGTVGEAATSVNVTITADATQAGLLGSVDYTTADATATGGATCAVSGSDYVITSGTANGWSAATLVGDVYRRTQTIAITLCPDSTYEGSGETFSFILSNPQLAEGATGTATIVTSTQLVTITDNDTAPTVSAPAAAVSVNEGNDGANPGTAVTLTFVRSAAVPVTSTATYTLSAGASNPANAADFASGGAPAAAFPTGTVSFLPNMTSATATVYLSGDTDVEPGELFTVTLSAPTNATIGTAARTGNTIVNDDTVLKIAIENEGFAPEVDEPASGSTLFPMRVSFVSGSAPSTGLSLTYTPSGTNLNDAGAACGGADEDYRLTATSATVTAGSSAFQSFSVEVCANTVAEADEILRIALTVAGGHAIVQSPGYAEITIHDIDKVITGKVVADRDANGSYGGTDALLKSRPVLAYRDNGDGVFNPENGDGIYDPSTEDQPLAGSPFSSGSSGGSTGIYTISGLSAGTFWVTHTVQTGFEAVYARPGTGAIKVDQAGYEKNLIKVTLDGTNGTGSAAEENSFFEARRGSVISGQVVDDLDGNGAVGASEPGLESATVTLYRDDPLASNVGSVVGTRDAHDEPIGTLTGDTLSGGVFVFGGDDPETAVDEDLLPGTYFLVETNPADYGDTGYVLGTVAGGATGSAVTRVSDNEFKVVLVNAATTQPTSSGNDFLDAAQTGTIGGLIRNDAAGDGDASGATSMSLLLDASTVTIYRDNTKAGTVGSLDAADTQTWTPSTTGSVFSQDKLTPGVYFVKAAATDYLSTNVSPDPDGVGTATKVANDQIKITIPAGGGTNGDNAFLLSLARSTVSGYVYDDLNANTLDDELSKVGVIGAVVRIYRETSGTLTSGFDFVDRNGNGMFDVATETTTEELISTSVATTSSGAFSFPGLRNGTYYLLRSNPGGTWTSMNAFPESGRVTVNRVTVAVTGALASTSTDTVYLAALATAQIGVSVVEDIQGDSAALTPNYADDTALSGASLTLYRDDPLGTGSGSIVGSFDESDPIVSTQDLPTTSTHTFTGLLVGTYFVVETDPTGYQSVTAVPGASAMNEYAGDPLAIVKNRLKVVIAQAIPTSSAGANSTGNRFVDESVYSISGFVLNDSNADGAANDGGLRLAGATVALYVDNLSEGTPGTYDAGVDPAWSGVEGDAATKVTDVTGSFGFGLDGLPTPGTYFVVLSSAPANYGSTEALPSTVTEGVAPDPVYGASKESVSVIQVDLGTTRNSTGNRFLLTRNDYVISAAGVNDVAADLLDTDDPALADVVVTLYRTAIADANKVGLPKTTTASAGDTVSFEGLTAGTYFLVGAPPSGYTATNTLPGSGTTSTTSIDRTTIRVVITAPGLVGDAAKVSSGNRFLAAVAGSSISGAVKEDVDASLTDSAPDTALSGSTVTLWLDYKSGTGVGTFDALIDKQWGTVTTDETGLFAFGSLPTGTYFLVETNPAGYGSFTALPDARRETVDRLKISGIDGTSGTDSTGNLFLNAIANASLAGIVYDDADGNGAVTYAIDPTTGLSTQSEFGKDGVTVTISVDVNADTVADFTSTTTTSTLASIAGSFSFSNLVQGSYSVAYTLPTGWRNTGISPNTNPQTVAVARSASSTGTLFFTQQANATILGQVFNDTSGDGVWQKSGGSAESVAGSNIRIYIDGYDGVAANGVWDSATEPAALTTSTGTFTITGVAKGTYKVQIDLSTAPGKATINAPVSATLTAGGSATGRNIGIQAASTLTGYVYDDVNGSGTVQAGWDLPKSGVTVHAYRDMSATGALTGDGSLTAADITGSTARVWSTTTDANGYFAFTPVPTGTYFIIEGDPVLSGGQYDGTTNYPSGYRSTAAVVCASSCAANTSAYTASTSNRMKVTIAVAAAVSGTTTTPGYFLDAATDSVTISGTVYNDTNADGVVAVGSSGVQNAVVKVFKDLDGDHAVDDDGDNTQEAGEDLQMWPAVGSSSTTTPAAGTYAWSDLPIGAYLVQETDPTNFSSTNAIPDSGGAGRTLTKISDNVIEVVVSAASTTSSSNFFLDTADNDVVISGHVYSDANADGTKNGDDAGLADAVVRVYKDSGNGTFLLAEETLMYATHADGVRREARTTPSDGTFSFGDLPTGTYWIVQTTPTGYSSIMTQSGSGTNTTVTLQTAARTRILVAASAASATRSGLEFLDTRDDSVTISGTVYNDVNADGAVAVGSPGLAASTMKIFRDANGNGAVDDDGDNVQEAGEDLQMWQATNASPWRSATVTAAAGGTYSFSGLPTGTYLVVQASDPSGYSSTNAIADTGTTGRTATKKTNDVIEVAVTDVSTTSSTNLFLDTPDNDVTVAGHVYDDLDADGTKDTTAGVDHTLANVQVRVYRDGGNGSFDYTDTNGNGRFDVATETTTDTLIWATHADGTRREYRTTAADGSFSFGDLPTGTHFIVQTLPSGYSAVKTKPDPAGTSGNITATPSASDKTLIKVATSGASGPWTRSDLEFIDTRDDGVTIRGFVYSDANGDGVYNGSDFGLAGATVRLYKDADADGQFSAINDTLMHPTVNGGARASSKTTTAAAGAYGAGEYVFGGLPKGTYFVVETDPSGGYTSTGVEVSSAKASAESGAPKDRIKVVPDTDAETISGNLFLDAIPNGSLSGVMVDDLNGNGVRDASKKAGNSKADDPLNGGVITLFKDDGDGVLETDGDDVDEAGEDTYVGWTTTSGTAAGLDLGEWSYSGLLPGTYFVRQDPPIVTTVDGDVDYRPSGATFKSTGSDSCDKGTPKICATVDADRTVGATPYRVKGEWLRVRISPTGGDERMTWGNLDFLAQGADFEIAITNDSDYDADGDVDAVTSRYAGTPSVAVGEPGIYTVKVTNAGVGIAPAGALVTVRYPLGAKVGRISGGDILDVNTCATGTTTRSGATVGYWSCKTRYTLAGATSVDILLAIQVPPSFGTGDFLVDAEIYSAGDSNLVGDTIDGVLRGFNGPVDDVDAITPAADITIDKSESNAAVAGATGDQALEYTIVVTNAGPSVAASTVITETLPDPATFTKARYCIVVPVTQPCTADAAFTEWTGTTEVALGAVASESGTWAWPIPGGYTSSATTTVKVRLDVGSGVNPTQLPVPTFKLTNTAAVTTTATYLSASEDRTDSVDSGVTTSADLSVSKTTATAESVDGTDYVVAGEQIVYHVDIANAGPSDAQSVDIAEILPSADASDVPTGLTDVEWCAYVLLPTPSAACTPSTSLTGATPTFTLANAIVKGQTVRVIVSGTIPSTIDKDEKLTNEATVSSDTPDPDAPAVTDLTDSVTDTVAIVADLGADWELPAGADPMIDEELTYDLIISNLGPSDSRAITVVAGLDGLVAPDLVDEILPEGMTCGAPDLDAKTLTCSISYLSAGAERVITLTGTAGYGSAGTYPDTTGAPEDIWDFSNEVSVTSTYSAEPEDEEAENLDVVDIEVDKRPVVVDLTLETLVPMYGKTIVIDAAITDAETGLPLAGRQFDFVIDCNDDVQTYTDALATDAQGETQAVFTVDVEPDTTCTISAEHPSGTSRWVDEVDATPADIRVDKFELMVGYTGSLFIEVLPNAVPTSTTLVPQAWVGWSPVEDLNDVTASTLVGSTELDDPELPELTFIVNKVNLTDGSLTYEATCTATDPVDATKTWEWTYRCTPSFTPAVNTTYEITMRVPASDPFFQAPDQKVYVTVFQPSPDMYATGGGFILGADSDPGLIDVSSAYDHINFSFHVKYKKGANTKTTSPAGAFFLRFHGADGWDYRARSTAWSKGALIFSGLNSKASFQSAMTLTRIDPITGLADPTYGGGNYTLRVDVTGDVLTKIRTIAFTIYTPKGSIVFYQAGTIIAQKPLGGGSIVVKSK